MSSVSALGSSQISSEITDYEQRLEAPITQLEGEITTDKADISAWGTIQGTLSTLSTSLSGLEDLSTVNTRTASVGTSSVLAATASSAALPGTYNVTVGSLASLQEIYSSAKLATSASAKIGSGTLTFSFGSGSKPKTEVVTVGSGSTTLSGIASAINKVAGGVKAGVVSTATGAELTLQSSATGASQAFNVVGTGALTKFDYSNKSSGTTSSMMFKAQTAGNSSLKVNGVPITGTSNTVSAMTGVSLTLNSTGTSTLTVGSSPAVISNMVGTVATNLNAAIAGITKATYWGGSSTTTSSASASSAKKTGALAGNYTAESISNQLLAAVSGAAASGMSANAIGLTVSSKGAVALNSTTFASAYAKNPTAVKNLISDIYTGLSAATKTALGSSTGTTDTGASTGTIAAQTNSYQSTITSINSQITQMEKTDTVELNNLADAYSSAESASTNASITQMYLDIYTSTSSSTG